MAQLRHAQPGQAAIPAADYNAMIDMARNHYAGLGQSGPTPQHLPAEQVWVRNDSGEDVPRFGVLGIQGLVFDPAEAPNQFADEVVLVGVEPTLSDHDGRFAVTVEPIPSGRLGRAKIDGTVQVKIDKQAEDDTTAGVADGHTTQLAGGGTGAQVLWAEAGTGTKWAVVRFGSPAGSAIRLFRYVSQSNAQSNIIAHTWDGVAEGTEPIPIEPGPYPPRMEAGDDLFAFQYSADGETRWRLLWTPELPAGGFGGGSVPNGFVHRIQDGWSELGYVTLID
jgi:hypothetical protein